MTTPRVLSDLTFEDVRDLDRPRTVAVLPTGAIEAHGPHLPRAHEAEELEETDPRRQGDHGHSEGRGPQEERGQEGGERDQGGAHPSREVAPEIGQTGVIPP